MRGRDCCWKPADHFHPATEVSPSVFWLCAGLASVGLNGDVAEADQGRDDGSRVDGEDPGRRGMAEMPFLRIQTVSHGGGGAGPERMRDHAGRHQYGWRAGRGRPARGSTARPCEESLMKARSWPSPCSCPARLRASSSKLRSCGAPFGRVNFLLENEEPISLGYTFW
jgi:hypothetical protein